MELADRLYELRQGQSYSQEHLAEMLGVSRQAVSKWESGQGNPEINNIIKLSEIYNVSTDYILKGTQSPEPILQNPLQTKTSTLKPILVTAITIGVIAIATLLFIAGLALITKLI